MYALLAEAALFFELVFSAPPVLPAEAEAPPADPDAGDEALWERSFDAAAKALATEGCKGVRKRKTFNTWYSVKASSPPSSRPTTAEK